MGSAMATIGKRNHLAGLALAVFAVAAMVCSKAEAGDRWRYNHGGAVAAGAIIGLAAGALIASSSYNNRYYYGGPVYYAPRYRYPPRYYYNRPYPYRSRAYVVPRRHFPEPVYRGANYAQFSPEWIAYCARKYKSFNPRTGTYLAYSGRVRMCR